MTVQLVDIGDEVLMLESKSHPDAIRSYEHWGIRKRHVLLRAPFTLEQLNDAVETLASSMRDDPPQDLLGRLDPRSAGL